MRYPGLLIFCSLLLCSSTERLNAVPSPAQDMTDAAANFLAALTPEEKTKASFEFKDEERFDWHFIPKSRKGLPIKDMTSPQRLLAHALLNSGLSQRGYLKATTIMSLEQILYDLENRAPQRNSELYFFSIFGTPGSGSWGWRVEGHHLSLNFTLNGAQVVAVTPSFFGANPAQIQSGPRKGLRILGGEEDLARKLVTSLNSDQQKTAIIKTEAPSDIITGNKRKVSALEPMGIPCSALSAEQKSILLELLTDYLSRYRSELAEADLKSIREAGDDKLYFAWAGKLEPGQGHYYRIQGQGFLMEYDNTQDKANHIHSVWRDLSNDFGEDPLRKHYQEAHSNR